MKTPIYDFVNDYSKQNTMRLHMPGHKGIQVIGCENIDITEINGADVLYSGDGIIAESEKNASEIFNTKKTLYSTEGSSLSIKAMLYLSMIYAKNQGKKPKILAFRNAHKSFMNAIAMLDIDVEWIFPKENNLLSCLIAPENLEQLILNCNTKPTALYITSPDYLGNIADIQSYSKICKKYDILLLVDNAHGAYLAFTNPSAHPITLGADITCDSAHKTLPVLTGGGYLHISKTAPQILADYAETAMQLFASTSPSYLIMSSLDKFNEMHTIFKEKLSIFTEIILKIKNDLSKYGFRLIGNEVLKITIETKSYGYTGKEFSEFLYTKNIICEFYDDDYIVMMFSPLMEESDIQYIKNTLFSLPQKAPLNQSAYLLPKPKKALEIREALMSPFTECNINDALGKTLATANISCPPAIPIIVAGEIIDKETIECFKYYGIEKCKIII